MQDGFYSGLKTQEIQIINHTIQYLNQDYFLTKALKPAHPDFLKPIDGHPNIRNSVRCLLINQNQEICLLYSQARDYYAIPGGGIEPGESLLQALSRETLEETGYLLKIQNRSVISTNNATTESIPPISSLPSQTRSFTQIICQMKSKKIIF